MIRRQALSAIVVSTLALLVSRSNAQSAGKATLIGILDAGEQLEWWGAFKQQLRELGYVEGRNVAFQARYAKGKLEDLQALAKELVQIKVAVIVTASTTAAMAAEHATRSVPIVMASGGDQVSRGLVASLGHSGGNITGMSSRSADIMGKRLELVREVSLKSSRFAVLWQADNVASMTSMKELDASAAKAQVSLQNFGIRDAGDLPGTFDQMTREGIGAIVVIHGPLIYGERTTITALALKHRLPAIYGAAEYADIGGLMAYGPSYPELFRRAAIYVDKILKGVKPSELPIEQATVFELVINANTARELGMTVPPSTLARANRVIQ